MPHLRWLVQSLSHISRIITAPSLVLWLKTSLRFRASVFQGHIFCVCWKSLSVISTLKQCNYTYPKGRQIFFLFSFHWTPETNVFRLWKWILSTFCGFHNFLVNYAVNFPFIFGFRCWSVNYVVIWLFCHWIPQLYFLNYRIKSGKKISCLRSPLLNYGIQLNFLYFASTAKKQLSAEPKSSASLLLSSKSALYWIPNSCSVANTQV